MNWIRFCKVFGTAHMIGAIFSSAMMWSATGEELIKGCIAMFYCMVVTVILTLIEYRLRGEEDERREITGKNRRSCKSYH